MNSETPLDYIEFQLSPKRTRYELFVSSGTHKEKLASGLLKPFVVNLKVAEEQLASTAQSFKLQVGRSKYADSWFTKGTLERFVQYVSTPDVIELVNKLDAEMSQLEAAQKIYSHGTGSQHFGGGGSTVATQASDDVTKKELLRAIDLRLGSLQQDLSNTCARAVATGFNVDSVSELQVFANTFGAHSLSEACSKFISLCERRPNLINQWKSGYDDQVVRSSFGSDMSIDDEDAPTSPQPHQKTVTYPIRSAFSRDSISEGDINGTKKETSTPDSIESIPLSVQDKINMFESKQKDHTGKKSTTTFAKPVGLRRLSSDVSTTMGTAAVLRRWSGVSDMSIDSSFEKKDTAESLLCNPLSSSSGALQKYKGLNLNDGSISKEGSNKLNSNLGLGSDGSAGWKDQLLGKAQSWITAKNQDSSEEKLKKMLGGKNESVVEFGGGEQLNIIENSKSEAVFATQPDLKSAGESGVSIRETFAACCKTEVVEKNEEKWGGSDKASSGHASGVEDSKPRRMRFIRRCSATKLDKEAKTQVMVAQDGFNSFTTTAPDQFQRAKQVKGNQELNDELKVKANEPEKLFDEHKKLRVPEEDQINSISPKLSRNYQTNKPSGSSKNKMKSNVLKKTDSQDICGTDDLNESFAMVSVSEGSPGKLYDKYMKKRDAKLKEDWSSKRAEKEDRFKSMQDIIERSRSEMKAIFLGSSAIRRAERLRSSSNMPIINGKEQHSDISYPHKISEVVECPSRNSSSHSFSQIEGDANTVRTRKKWEKDQNPVLLVAHSSGNSVACKDTASGFKRFLKFGRRNYGVSESLADWVSVTTSEGDEDAEGGVDCGNRSSEDLRKSRMGFSQCQPSVDNEFCNESAPRSFFSLSTFRSKGSEMKSG